MQADKIGSPLTFTIESQAELDEIQCALAGVAASDSGADDPSGASIVRRKPRNLAAERQGQPRGSVPNWLSPGREALHLLALKPKHC